MWIISVNFSGNAKKYDYVYREATVPSRLRYLSGMGTRGPWYQMVTVINQRAVDPSAVPAHVTKELVNRDGAVVAVDWVKPQPIKTAEPPVNNYKAYLTHIGQLAIHGTIHSWADYQKRFNELMKTQPYDPKTIY